MEAPRAQRSDRVRVLYVAGSGRSGSTIVSNLLGSSAGLTSVGELRYLWERGIGEQSLCGCGVPVPQCPFWHEVLRAAYGDDVPDVAAIRAADRSLLRLRTFPELLRAHGRAAELGPAALDYADHLARLYTALGSTTGGAVVVDSSKIITYAYLLRALPQIDLFVLHLVRDPRGVAHSWGRTLVRTDRGSGASAMSRAGAWESAVLYDVWNAAAELVWRGARDRYVRVRYEDFIADPQHALAPVLRMLNMSADLPIDGEGRIELSLSHTVAGNRGRMNTGPITLVADEEWRTAMPPWQRRAVGATTAPLLARYGYLRRRPTSAAVPGRLFVEDQQGVRRTWSRVTRNLRWIREQGLGRVLEEKEIDPLRTVPAAIAKRRYRRDAGVPPGTAQPVFVVGLQRSGTNMVMRGLGMMPEVEVRNESDPAAFDRYKLRSNDTVEAIVAASRHSYVIFKPLCDSHRTDELLDLPTKTKPKAVWIYRDMGGRVRSAVAKFGDGNLQVLREFAAGVNTTRWHVQRITPGTADFVRSFDFTTMTPESGAALMWLVRNTLFFDLGLERRSDVHLVSYNSFLAAAQPTTQALCGFLHLPYSPVLVAHVNARPPTHRASLDIDARITAACDELQARLDAVAGVDAVPSP